MSFYEICDSLLKSYIERDFVRIEKIKNWIEKLNSNIEVKIKKISLNDSRFWFIDDIGKIRNSKNSFFYISGLKETYSFNRSLNYTREQPIIVQDEIGYLGIICKEIDGVLYFLMQAKIEPGNINKIQISPTVQATMSNFTQRHGGNKPAYIDYFINASKYNIIVDSIQSEQASRFYKKRNRNMIIVIGDDIEILDNYKWMTLGEIKELMKIDNLVNMDSRTVISCLPLYKILPEISEKYKKYFFDEMFFSSVFNNDEINCLSIFNKINNYKMFLHQSIELIGLNCLNDWYMNNNEFICNNHYPYKIVFCDISIEGREVKEWDQPLFEAIGNCIFGLFIRSYNGKMEILVKLKHEIGCFDKLEIGPTIQLEPYFDRLDIVESCFLKYIEQYKDCIFYDHFLSEEGGRFYHEQNRNMVVFFNEKIKIDLPDSYMWVDYKTLNYLTQFSYIINIQLRNLMAILEGNQFDNKDWNLRNC